MSGKETAIGEIQKYAVKDKQGNAINFDDMVKVAKKLYAELYSA